MNSYFILVNTCLQLNAETILTKKTAYLFFVMMTYFVFGKSDRTGCTVRSVVQVLVVGRVVADVDWQNKAAREDPAQGIVNLRRYDNSVPVPSAVTFY